MTVALENRRAPEDRLRDEVAVAIARLRFAMIKWAAALAPGGIKKSRDIQKLFGIDAKLSWQVYRIINSDDPLELSPHIPSPAVMQTLMAAARRGAADEEALSKIAVAYAQFETLVNTYAEDRTTFDSMMARLIGGDADALVEFNYRRSMFEGQRYILGYESDATLTVHMLHPTKGVPGSADRVYLHTRNNIRRFSSNALINVSKRKTMQGAGQHPLQPEMPLDAEAAEQMGFAMLSRFSSAQRLPLTSRTLKDGSEIVELGSSEVGRTSATSLAFGSVRRDVLSRLADGQQVYDFGSNLTTPVRAVIWDVLVHRPTFGRVDFEMQRWANARGFPDETRDLEAEGMVPLKVREQMTFLSGGAAAAHLAEMPAYEEMLKFGCETQGWNLDEMDLYRLRIEYPLMHSYIEVRVKFPGSEHWPQPG